MRVARRPAVAVTLLLAASLAGCTSSGRSATSSSVPSAPPTVTAAVTGTLTTTAAPGTPPAATTAVTASTTATVSATATTTAATASTTGASSEQLPPPLAPGVAIPPGQVESAIAKVDGIASDVFGKSGIPGMAVAVVYRGKVVFSKGYGVRKVGEAARVDANTVFQLASVSKSVGATVIAHEVTAGKVSWDTPVAKNLPSFTLGDPYITKNATVADMYAHRSGLLDHAGDLLEDLGYTRQQILDRLRYLPLDPFRLNFHYTNFGLTAGAESVAAAAGKDWATLSKDDLYGPLGMASTSSRFVDYEKNTRRAYTHVKVNGKWVAQYVRDADAQSPAGGVSSSVSDMAKWMLMVLGNGTGSNGAKIASPDALTPAITPESFASKSAQPAERAGFYGYGFDVTTESSGRVEISHSGAFSAGTGTNFVLLPSADVGIITLTNGSPIGAAEAVNQEFADLVQYGKPMFDWYKLYNEALLDISGPFGQYAGKTPPSSPTPAAAPAVYTGTYGNDYVGDIQITAAGSNLSLTIGPKNMKFPLKHWDKDIFTYEPSGESANPGSVSAVTFTRNGTGKATKVDIEFYAQDGRGTFLRT